MLQSQRQQVLISGTWGLELSKTSVKVKNIRICQIFCSAKKNKFFHLQLHFQEAPYCRECVTFYVFNLLPSASRPINTSHISWIVIAVLVQLKNNFRAGLLVKQLLCSCQIENKGERIFGCLTLDGVALDFHRNTSNRK